MAGTRGADCLMRLRRVTASDLPFVFECLIELRGTVSYGFERFDKYIREEGLLGAQNCQLWLAENHEGPIGFLTCNRFAMPRYLGYGLEIEELVVHPRHQRKGYAGQVLSCLLDKVSEDPGLRKILVKTDDKLRAAKVYDRLFKVTQLIVYQKHNQAL